MTVSTVAIWALLGVAVVSAVAASLGLLLARDAFDRLHFASLAGMTAPVFVAAAGVVQEWPSSSTIKVVLIALVLVGASPVLAHALGRAAHVREHGRLEVGGGEERP